jgi:hypothetical protein
LLASEDTRHSTHDAQEYYRLDAGLHAGRSCWETTMTLCPVAMAVGCTKCPVFRICPAKGIIGDYKKEEPKAGGKKKQ